MKQSISTVIFLVVCITALFLSPALSKELVILHTNDMHSRLTPYKIDESGTPTHGWARVASVIKNEKSHNKDRLLVLDGGDFLMGTLFHTITREDAPELRLMYTMGYDAITLGNHEFDLGPGGLARIINSAARYKELPLLIASNMKFSTTDNSDDTLEKLTQKGLVKPYTVITRNGIRIGIFGILGKDAAEVAPFADPVTFSDQATTARAMVKKLKENEKVDLVICLSHSGLRENKKYSEDEILAREVKGIDIIISGHTHTVVPEPITVNNTIIVQAGAYTSYVGRLTVNYSPQKVSIKNYKLINLNETIKPDPETVSRIQGYTSIINNHFLKPQGLRARQVIAYSPYSLKWVENETPLGNLVADSMLWYANQMMAKNGSNEQADIAVMSNGLIRENIYGKKSGDLTTSDLFMVLPLGIGSDDTMGYPLVSLYVTGEEIKKALEVLTSIHPLKGSDYYLQISGLRFTYNPNRMIFDRVTSIELGNKEKGFTKLDTTSANKELYCIVSDIYNATFLKIIGSFTSGILTIVPKDKKGKPVSSLSTRRIDSDPDTKGIQETKEWLGLIRYIQQFRDTDNDGIPEIPERYSGPEGRITKAASWNPVELVGSGTYMTRVPVAIIILLISIIVFTVIKLWKRHKKEGA